MIIQCYGGASATVAFRDFLVMDHEELLRFHTLLPFGVDRFPFISDENSSDKGLLLGVSLGPIDMV